MKIMANIIAFRILFDSVNRDRTISIIIAGIISNGGKGGAT